MKSTLIIEKTCKHIGIDDGTNLFIVLSTLLSENEDISKLVQYELLYTDCCKSCNCISTYTFVNNILPLLKLRVARMFLNYKN